MGQARFETKPKKRKHSDIIDNEEDMDDRAIEEPESEKKKQSKKSKAADQQSTTQPTNPAAPTRTTASDTNGRKRKHEEVAQDDEKDADAPVDPKETGKDEDDGSQAPPKKRNRKKRKGGGGGEKKLRHIVFVGNLPYSATEESIRAHFKTLPATSVRCLTDPKNKSKCRGIAFVDFPTAEDQRQALNKYHLSEFDDGKAAPRKINLELTAGGGGRTDGRMEKIKAKNAKLALNRTKMAMKEELTQGSKSRESKDRTAAETTEAKGNTRNVHASRTRALGSK